jgi:hypothetical protein
VTTVRLFLEGDRAGPLFRRATQRQSDKVRAAVRGAAEEARENIEARGAADIAAAGNFGPRWTTGFHVDVREGGGNISINSKFGEGEWYWSVFEFGATIKAKNPTGYLTIPFFDEGQITFRRVPSVTIPQKFHLRDIIRQVAREFRGYYNERFKT